MVASSRILLSALCVSGVTFLVDDVQSAVYFRWQLLVEDVQIVLFVKCQFLVEDVQILPCISSGISC
jgi:hypothetical protein